MFPASRLSISALEGQLQDLTERFASLKSLTTNDPQLLPPSYVLPAVRVKESNINVMTDEADDVKHQHQQQHHLDGDVDYLTVATTTPRTPASSKESGPIPKSPSMKLYEIAHLKSSLREGVGSDGRRNLQHFDSVIDVRISTSDVATTRQAEVDIAAEMMPRETKLERGLKKVVLKGCTKQQLMLARFMEDVMVKLDQMELLLKNASEKYQNVLRYCGEDPELSSPDFFSTLHAFCSAFEEAKRYVDRQSRSRERQRRIDGKKKKAVEAEAAATAAKLQQEEKTENSRESTIAF